MPEFTIDGKTYEYDGNPMLLQYCLDNGIEIPYFCYHPAMSVPTNCRMCLCEVGYPAKDRATGEAILEEDGSPKVNWGRKPATACNQPISPGMIVKTSHNSKEVAGYQKGVLEYMLVNHPLDCPICDQAGECPLQIWTYKYGPEGSRFENQKVHKPKRIELGPNVVLDGERCINCTRCTRFTEEISGSWQLTIANRGEKNYPATAPGDTFDDPYSMNTIDLCPVGALTSKDFRFQARVWEMAYTPGVCTGCSKGCNVDVWVRDNQVMRLTPRENPDVNQYWMCDEGRLAIDQFNEGRVSGAKFKGDVPQDFDTGIIRIAHLIQNEPDSSKIFFLGSPKASLESNFALRALAKQLGAKTPSYVPHVEEGWGDDFLRKDDRTPNSGGCELLGFRATSVQALQEALRNGSIRFLYVSEDDTTLAALAADLDNVTVIAHSTHHTEAHEKVEVTLPAAMSIEAESTYLNGDGKAQVSKMAKEIKQMSPEMWMRLPKSRNDKAAVAVDRWRNLEHVYDVLPGWQLFAKVGRQLGHDVSYREHRDIFQKMKAEFDVLRDVKVSYKVPKEAFKISQYDFAVR